MGLLDKITDAVADKVADRIADEKKGFFGLKTPYLKTLWEENESGQKKLTQPYKQLSAVYAAIRAKAMNISQVPFRLYPLGGDNEVTSGPVYELFRSPGYKQTSQEFFEGIATYLDMKGESPILLDYSVTSRVGNVEVPNSMVLVDPDKLQDKTKNGALDHWEVELSNGVLWVDRDGIVMPRYFNPYNSIRGLSPITALWLSLESEWGAVKYNQVFFEKGQTPGAVFSTEGSLSPTQRRQMERELIESREGVNKAHKALLLEGGVSLSNVRPSNRDMEYLKMRGFNREEIAMVFKVPKAELSLYEDVNYATALSADLSFWKKTLIPEMNLISEKLNREVLRPLGYWGKFDVQSVDVLNSEVLEKAETAQVFYNMGYTRDEINERLRLGFPQGTDGREEEKPEGEPKSIKKGQDEIIAIRQKRWKSLMDKVLPVMGQASSVMKSYFYDIEQKVLKQLSKKLEGYSFKAPVDEFDVTVLERYFDDEALKRKMEGPIKKASDTGKSTIAEGAPVPVPPDLTVNQVIMRRVNKLTGINETAHKNLIDRIRKALDEASKQGMTEREAAQHVYNNAKDSMRISARRAKTIARTEIHGAYNESRHVTAERTGFTKKRWLATPDERTRDTHRVLGEQPAIGMEEEYKTFLGESLRYPHDPNASAGEVVNCRCIEDYIAEDEE